MIIGFDTETTGLLKPEGNDISVQPHIVEIYAAKYDNGNKFVSDFHSKVKPPIPIPKEVTRVHGLTDYDVKDSPTFAQIFQPLVNIFFGCHTIVAHNLTFDLKVLVVELMRVGKMFKFPYPPIHFCTIEQSMHIKGHRLKNSELYTIATGKEIIDAHQAKNDVLAMMESYFWLKNGGECV